MVIQCSQCDTRFRIADEKLKPGGIKVRCSKCRNIFTVMPPEPEQPAPSPESAGKDEIDFGAFNMKPVPEESPVSGTDAEADRKEKEEAEASEVTAGAGFAMKTPADFDFDEKPAGEKEPAETAFEEESSAEKELPKFDFEEESSGEQGLPKFDFEEESSGEQSLPEFGFEEESTDQSSLEFGFEEEEDADRPADFSFDETDPFPDTGAEDRWETETGAGAPADFDFGDERRESAEVDDFDLSGMTFGDEDSPAAPRNEKTESIPTEQVPEIEEQTFTPPPPKRREPGGGKEAAAPASLPRRKSPFKGLLMFVLVLLLALCGVAGYFFWQRGSLDLVKIVEQVTGQGTPAAVEGQIRLSELSSSFVTNREAGQLFVIHGKATNEYPETRSAIAVKAVLYNNNGQPLLQQTVFCGTPLEVEALGRMPFARIEEGMNNQFGDSLSNLNVGPGKSIPFTIVFRDLPPALAEYTVEAVDSKPGSKP